MASDGPLENPSVAEDSTAQNPPVKKDTATLFKEAFERAKNMTHEEILAKHPSWRGLGGTVTVDKGMQILEEMEREEREEAAKCEENETSSAHGASS